jgi:anti-anti-sigma factor
MRAVPEAGPGFADGVPFEVTISRRGKNRVVHVCGEIDVATRHLVRRACLSGWRKSVIVEMSDTTFMDCCGYGGLVAARRALEQHGGSLSVRNQVGQPAHLLVMLDMLEARN